MKSTVAVSAFNYQVALHLIWHYLSSPFRTLSILNSPFQICLLSFFPRFLNHFKRQILLKFNFLVVFLIDFLFFTVLGRLGFRGAINFDIFFLLLLLFLFVNLDMLVICLLFGFFSRCNNFKFLSVNFIVFLVLIHLFHRHLYLSSLLLHVLKRFFLFDLYHLFWFIRRYLFLRTILFLRSPLWWRLALLFFFDFHSLLLYFNFLGWLINLGRQLMFSLDFLTS